MRNSNLILHHIIYRGLYFFSVLLLNICIARFFAAEKSGQIFYTVNNLTLILLLVSVSLESGTAYYISAGSLETSAIARFCFIWATAASLVAVAVWWSVLYFSHSVYLGNTGFLFASFLFIAGVLYTSYFTALFYAKKEFGLPNKILFFVNILLVVILILGKFYLSIRDHFILIYFSSFFLQGLLMNIFFFRQQYSTGRPFMPSNQILKKIMLYSLAALVANLIYFLVNRVDYWFVEYFCSAKDLGNYIQASKLGQMLLILPGILGSTLFPIFSSQTKTGNTFELAATIRTLLWINSGICIMIICFGWYVFPLVFGVSFKNMYLLFLFLIPGILAITMNYPMAAWFSAGKRIGINTRGGLIALLVICAGDLFLLPRYGVRAAPVISSIGFMCFYFYTIYQYRREYAVPWKDFVIFRKSDLAILRESITSKIRNLSSEDTIIPNSST